MIEMLFWALAVFLIRLGFSFLPSFAIDMGTWLSWAARLSSVGLARFYSDTVWTQYTPGFMYYLWAVGKLGWYSDLAVKIPVILADLATAFLIWSVVRKVSKKLALLSFFVYVLNPVVIFDGSVWGQIDGILTFLLFLSACFWIEKKNFILSIFVWSLAFLIKPQAIAILPAFLVPIILKQVKIGQMLVAIFTGSLTILALSLPFFPKNPVFGLPNWIIKMGSFYSYTSVNAFNIWSWIGFWKPDGMKFLNINLYVWGIILLVGAILTALFVFKSKLDQKANHYLLFAVVSLCFFLFPTRVHERYLFPFFAFLLTSASLSKSKNLFGVYVASSILSFLNLYYPYAYYNQNFLKLEFLYKFSEASAKLVGFTLLVFYFVLLWWEKLPKNLISFPKASSKSDLVLPKSGISKRVKKYLLITILAFSFATRVFNLGSPPSEYFDEVYHAFTAKVVLSPEAHEAWEWWNTPPTGFAYEWTHPPLAKLGMALGMLIFGQNSFGYRIPGAILGVGSVLLVYLIAKVLFDDELLALFSAAAFSLDGLVLVMSRTGMNDSYLLFFVLLSIYLFLKEKDFGSALSFGLAISSKWSAIWVVPILFILWWRRKKKLRMSLLWFLLLPFTIYLLTYLQMFLTGHDFSVWWEMQKQMWWYHTGLKATHAYSSSWWSWPFLVRPIYLYTSEEVGGMVTRIYAMGNPVIFWFGLASIVFAFLNAVSGNYAATRIKNLGLTIFSYIVFFVPWALSPRIMFLYHYLPSIPFMCIAIGYVLRTNKKLVLPFFISALVLFIYFYPHWAGLKVPLSLDASYYWLPSWR